jgi:hypothetical protein
MALDERRSARRSAAGVCALCGAERELTFHHLIPQKLHRRPRFRRRHTRAELDAGILVCRLCHRGLHALHDEMTLGTRLASREALLADEAVARHVAWSARQRVGRRTERPD